MSFRDGRYRLPPVAEFLARCALAASPRRHGKGTATRHSSAPGVRLEWDELAEALASLGIHPNDTLMVHSSVSAIEGWDREPGEMIDFLLDYLGPRGTLAMPTHPKLLRDGDREVYDVQRSPSTVGLLTELLRRRSGAVRSQFPVSAAAAVGARAEELVTDHANSFAPHDEHSPYAKLALLDGKVVCIGVSLDRMTILHVAEDVERSALGIPGFYESREILVRNGEEEFSMTVHTRAPWLWWYLSLARWSYDVLKMGIACERRLSGVALRAADARAGVEWMREEIRQGRSIYPLAWLNRWLRLPPPRTEDDA